LPKGSRQERVDELLRRTEAESVGGERNSLIEKLRLSCRAAGPLQENQMRVTREGTTPQGAGEEERGSGGQSLPTLWDFNYGEKLLLPRWGVRAVKSEARNRKNTSSPEIGGRS